MHILLTGGKGHTALPGQFSRSAGPSAQRRYREKGFDGPGLARFQKPHRICAFSIGRIYHMGNRFDTEEITAGRTVDDGVRQIIIWPDRQPMRWPIYADVALAPGEAAINQLTAKPIGHFGERLPLLRNTVLSVDPPSAQRDVKPRLRLRKMRVYAETGGDWLIAVIGDADMMMVTILTQIKMLVRGKRAWPIASVIRMPQMPISNHFPRREEAGAVNEVQRLNLRKIWAGPEIAEPRISNPV